MNKRAYEENESAVFRFDDAMDDEAFAVSDGDAAGADDSSAEKEMRAARASYIISHGGELPEGEEDGVAADSDKGTAAGTKSASIPETYQRAVRAALNILTYGDNTEKRLRDKLARKRYTPDAIDFAVRYVITHGFLHEDRQLREAVWRLTEKKRYGRRRVIAELYRLGFPRAAIAAAESEGVFDEPDYVTNCLLLWEKQGGETDRRTVSYLMRYGYTGDDIRAASRRLPKKPAES